tara:strand:- start:1521 stop:3311 length:1791 start_codon:yes stop_codon:yes gene_type:complete
MKKLFSHFRGDLFGGLTAGIVALPLALAFGVQSGLGATAGIYGALFIGFFAAWFGGTPTQISGPTAPMTAVSMGVIAGIVATMEGDLEKALPIILAVFLLAGLIQIVMGLLKFGVYVKYIPYPVVSGFMTGIGVIILITQIFSLVGYVPKNDQSLIESFKPRAEEAILEKILVNEVNEGLLVLEDFKETVIKAEKTTENEIYLEAETQLKRDTSGVLGSLKYLSRALKQIDVLNLILAALTILIIYSFKRVTKKIPSTLVALILVTSLAYFSGWDYRSISDIPRGFPVPQWGIFTDIKILIILPYIGAAFMLAALGAIDSLLTSVVADNMTKTRHNPNKELIGQGIGNGVAALFGGIPGAGATIRTVVNIQSGGKTKLSGAIAAIFLLLVVLFVGPFAEKIPMAVLAGILFTVGISVMDFKGLRSLTSIPYTDAIVMILVLLLTVFWDLIFAVGIGLILSSLFFMAKIADITTDKINLKEPKNESNAETSILIKTIVGPIFFGAVSGLIEVSRKLPDTVKVLCVDLSEVPYIDQSGLFALEGIFFGLNESGIEVRLIGLNSELAHRFNDLMIVPNIVSADLIFDDIDSAVAHKTLS